MFNVEEKIEHLRKIGFLNETTTFDIAEIEKAYSGLPFKPYDEGYLSLVNFSKQLCNNYNDAMEKVGKVYSPKEYKNLPSFLREEYDEKLATTKKNRMDIIDKLFPGHGVIFNVVQGVSAVVGMVDLGNMVYLNKNVHFSPLNLVKTGDYNLFASNVSIGDDITSLNANMCANRGITIQDDVWFGASVKVKGGSTIGARSVLGLGAQVFSNITTPTDSLVLGSPAKAVVTITPEHQGKQYLTQRTPEEIDTIIGHLKSLGFDGDFNEYIKALNGEKYNCLTSLLGEIAEYSHNLCEEYNLAKTSPERKEEILKILVPIQGENFKVGKNLFVDYIGNVSVGDNVTIGDGVVLAGNVKLGNNVTVGNNCALQTIGHEIYFEGRHIGQEADGTPIEYCTTSFINVGDDVAIGENTQVAPGANVNDDIPSNSIVTPKGDILPYNQTEDSGLEMND